jgi:hypothetical protein
MNSRLPGCSSNVLDVRVSRRAAAVNPLLASLRDSSSFTITLFAPTNRNALPPRRIGGSRSRCLAMVSGVRVPHRSLAHGLRRRNVLGSLAVHRGPAVDPHP